MKRLQVRLLMLISGLALFFNIERLGSASVETVGPQEFVYGLVTLAVLSILATSFLPRRWLLTLALVWIPIYLLARWFIFSRYPLMGGVYSYVTWTEITFMSYIVATAYLTARSLREFREAVAYLTFLQTNGSLPTLDEAEDMVNAEVLRSRHSERPLSVIALTLERQTLAAQIDPFVAEVQEMMGQRVARLQLMNQVREDLRPIDLLLETRQNDLILAVCPEADRAGCTVLADRMRTTLDGAGVAAHYAVSTFPDDGVTFAALVDSVKSKLESEAVPIQGMGAQTAIS